MESTISASDLDTGVTQRLRLILQQTRGWVNFLGIVYIVIGAITAIFIIPIINIVIGVFLRKAAKGAQTYIQNADPQGLIEYNARLKTYFIITGVLTIIGLAFLVIYIIVLFVVLAAGAFPF